VESADATMTVAAIATVRIVFAKCEPFWSFRSARTARKGQKWQKSALIDHAILKNVIFNG
jgi:hypothetical protein